MMAGWLCRAMVKLTGVWANQNKYVFLDIDSGQEHPIFIPGANLLDKAEMEEVLCWQQERVAKDIADRAPKPSLSDTQQHDLGQTLLQVRASKVFRIENLHGRYW